MVDLSHPLSLLPGGVTEGMESKTRAPTVAPMSR